MPHKDRNQRREYHRRYMKERYDRDPRARAVQLAASARNRKKARQVKRKIVDDFLAATPCVDCGDPDPEHLEFDHVRGKKVSEIANMVRDGSSVAALKAEIAKCEIRCTYCHRKVTKARRLDPLPSTQNDHPTLW